MASKTEFNNDLARVYKTILLFLESQNLQKTYTMLVQEAIDFGITNVEEADPKILVLKPCRCDVLNFPYDTNSSIQNETYILETAMTVDQARKSQYSRNQLCEYDYQTSISDVKEEEAEQYYDQEEYIRDGSNYKERSAVYDSCYQMNAYNQSTQSTYDRDYNRYKSDGTISTDMNEEYSSEVIESLPIYHQNEYKSKSGLVDPIRGVSSVRFDNYTVFTAFSQADIETTNQQYFQLDYDKLKDEFRNNENVSEICKLLQALRWRLTKTPPMMKHIIMSQYAEGDLLGILSEESILMKLYHMPDVQSCIARFVNTVASLSIGRSYLTQQDCILVDLLCDLLRGSCNETQAIQSDLVRDHIFVTIQKLSLRKIVREKLIESEFVEFLIEFLGDNYSSLSSYALEYTMALYMNLCLNNKTIDICRKLGPVVITLLINILNTRHEFCLPYITGSLYNLLADEDINNNAKNLRLENVLQQHVMNSSGVVRSQLEYILEVHRSSKSCQMLSVDEINENEEVDHIEIELDSFDDVNGINGEDLLQDYVLQKKVLRCSDIKAADVAAKKSSVQKNASVNSRIMSKTEACKPSKSQIDIKSSTSMKEIRSESKQIQKVDNLCNENKRRSNKCGTEQKFKKKSNLKMSTTSRINNPSIGSNISYEPKCVRMNCRENCLKHYCKNTNEIMSRQCKQPSYNLCWKRWYCGRCPSCK